MPTTRAPPSLGHGAGYEYPHDHDGGWVAQQYLPDPIVDRRWYEPSDHGFETGDRRPHAGSTKHEIERGSSKMTAGDLAVTLAAVLCAIGFAALIVVLVRVLDTLKALRIEVESLRRETGPLLAELRESTDEAREAMDTARDDLERFDRVLGSAEAISDAVDGQQPARAAGVLGAGDQGRRHRHGHQPHRAAAPAQGVLDRARRRHRTTPEASMMRRVTWFVGGVVAGAAGAGYAKKKVRSDRRPTGAGQRRQVGRRAGARPGPPRRRRGP